MTTDKLNLENALSKLIETQGGDLLRNALSAGQSHQGIINSLIQIKSIIFLMVMSEQSHQD
mgnify:CR=1 FL=1